MAQVERSSGLLLLHLTSHFLIILSLVSTSSAQQHSNHPFQLQVQQQLPSRSHQQVQAAKRQDEAIQHILDGTQNSASQSTHLNSRSQSVNLSSGSKQTTQADIFDQQAPGLITKHQSFEQQLDGSQSMRPSSVNYDANSNRLLVRRRRSEDVCADRLCYGLPFGCLHQAPSNQGDISRVEKSGSLCNVLVTSKHLIDPYRPIARDIHFELVALPKIGRGNYAAVGFSDTGRMLGLVTECLQYKNPDSHLNVVRLEHSYNLPGAYNNVPVTILSGIKNLGVTYENGYYQCRWVVESAVEFTYEDVNGTIVNQREDLGYKNYHILLATGEYNEQNNFKSIHTDRISSATPISLAQKQVGHIQSLGTHILIRIHGSLMIAIWLGLVTLSLILARYYKNEWSNSKINELAIWFVLHRALMLIAWFGSIIAVIFAYTYTETYHAGLHQIAGTTCVVLSTIQVLGGLLRPSNESNKRLYFNWAHFICGNLSYLCAMVSIISAAYLAPAHLPPIYIWVVAAFVAIYALTHLLMTIHQYIVHKSSKISITPMSDLNDTNSSSATYSSCGFVADSYPKETNSTFRQVMLGILVTLIVIFIILLISLVNIR